MYETIRNNTRKLKNSRKEVFDKVIPEIGLNIMKHILKYNKTNPNPKCHMDITKIFNEMIPNFRDNEIEIVAAKLKKYFEEIGFLVVRDGERHITIYWNA